MATLALVQRIRNDLKSAPSSLGRYLILGVAGAIALTIAQAYSKPAPPPQLEQPPPVWRGLEKPASTVPPQDEDSLRDMVDLEIFSKSADYASARREIQRILQRSRTENVANMTGYDGLPRETLGVGYDFKNRPRAAGSIAKALATIDLLERNDRFEKRLCSVSNGYCFESDLGFDANNLLWTMFSKNSDEEFTVAKSPIPFLALARSGPPRLEFPDTGKHIEADANVDTGGTVGAGSDINR